ncbi:pupal cuticle protein Edg-78E [Scaptodrosophila lebanonensis]|uniref:Pupal cuticle protein Edg-78E n=1 Tax=Drosophila lebanonensis TaxID=7225 RepID=A0A6J2UBC1_DROLE|nr:pupal cuticle protein Edg-78E [Scaptodrosophila lebanonensis]
MYKIVSKAHFTNLNQTRTPMTTKLQFILIAAALLAFAQARPDAYDAAAETRDFKSDLKEDGSYSYQYQTSNGIAAQETGVGGYYASGSSAYYAPDGQLVQLTYTADENGYHPSGAHLPTPPPIPAAILKALEYIRTHPHQEERQGAQQLRYRPLKF